MIESDRGDLAKFSVRVLESGAQFLDICRDWLDQDEVANNTLLSVAALTDSKETLIGPPFWFGVVVEGNEIVGACVYANPDGVLVTKMSTEAAHHLVDAFLKSGLPPFRIHGEEHTVRTVARAISYSTGAEYFESCLWAGFILTELNELNRVAPGQLRLADPSEEEVIVRFGKQYGEEKPAVVDVPSYFLRKVKDKMLWAWDDGGVKTLISTSGRTPNGIRVSGVFTPVEFRGNGYASTAVWRVSEHYMKNEGCSFCTLVVDKSDPHVMRIYEKLGYRRIDDRLELRVKFKSG